MRFFLTASGALVLLLAIADYRFWQHYAQRFEFSKPQLERELFQQIYEARFRGAVQVVSLDLTTGSEPDELGLELGVTLFGDAPKTVVYDAKAYEAGGRIGVLHLCPREMPEQEKDPREWRVYAKALSDQLGYARFLLDVPGVPSRAGYSFALPVKRFTLDGNVVVMKTGLAATVDEAMHLPVGQAWPECEN